MFGLAPLLAARIPVPAFSSVGHMPRDGIVGSHRNSTFFEESGLPLQSLGLALGIQPHWPKLQVAEQGRGRVSGLSRHKDATGSLGSFTLSDGGRLMASISLI